MNLNARNNAKQFQKGTVGKIASKSHIVHTHARVLEEKFWIAVSVCVSPCF